MSQVGKQLRQTCVLDQSQVQPSSLGIPLHWEDAPVLKICRLDVHDDNSAENP